jgi:hypothetical protein
MVVSPTFRWAVFLLLLLAGAGIYKLIQQSNEDAEYRQREATSRTLIQPSQLVLNNVQLGQSYGLWKVNGTVQNNSQHRRSAMLKSRADPDEARRIASNIAKLPKLLGKG